MAHASKLVNPTPYSVDIPYERGISLKVDPDSELLLTPGQMEDFRPGKPGYEAARKILEFEGVFLWDTDLSYEVQALTALRMAVRERNDRVKNFIDRTRNSRIAGGATVDDATMQDLIVASGYDKMQKYVEVLTKRIKVLEAAVDKDVTKGQIRNSFDPERTCFVINPPKQFASKIALQMFLDENPEVKKQHLAMTKPAKTKVVEEEVE